MLKTRLRLFLGVFAELRKENIVVILYAFFWVISRRLNFMSRRFGTLFHLHRQVGVRNSSHLPAYEDETECSETSEYKIQTPGIYPEESIRHSEHGESLKSRISSSCLSVRLSAWNNSPSSGDLMFKYFFFNILSRKFKFHYNLTRITILYSKTDQHFVYRISLNSS